MSSLFGATRTVPQTPKLMGVRPEKTSSHERARAVPWIAGTRRVAINWIAPAMEQRAEEVQDEESSNEGKGSSGGDTTTTGYDYYATVAGVFVVGRCDALREVWFDDEKVWSGNVERSDDSAEITISGRGTMRLYWGTSTQPVDSFLEDYDHPAYRGQCYAVFEDLYFGKDKTQAPNIEAVLVRQPGQHSLTASSMVSGDDANPVHAMLDLLTSERYGLGWDSESLGLESLDAAAATIASEGMRISPLVTTAESAKGLVRRFCEYMDGFVSFRNDGKLHLTLARNPAGDISVYPLIGEYDLCERPSITSEPWASTSNDVWVTYTDRNNRYDADARQWRDLANQNVVGEPITVQVDRPWICRGDIAQRYAERWGRLHSVPLLSGRLILRKAAAAGIRPGEFIRFTFQEHDEVVLFRVKRRSVSDDRSLAVELEVETDRYYDAISEYEPDDAPGTELALLDPEPALEVRAIELPDQLVEDSDEKGKIWVAVLGARSSALQTKAIVFTSEDGTSYKRSDTGRSWALYGRIVTNSLTGLTVDRGDGILLDLTDLHGDPVVDRAWPSTTFKGMLRHQSLLFINDEILSYQTATVVSPTRVQLTNIRRALFGTSKQTHDAGDVVLSVREAKLRPVRLGRFDQGEDAYFKLSPATAAAKVPLSEISAEVLPLTGRTRRPMPPGNVRINGTYWDANYTNVGDVVVRWDAFSSKRPASLYELFDDPWDSDSKTMLKFYDVSGNVKRRVMVGASADSYTYTNAQILSDFGSVPTYIDVRLWHKRKSRNSFAFVKMRCSLTGNTNAGIKGTVMSPSLFGHVIGVCDPGSVIDRNFSLAAAHFSVSLPYPTLSGVDEDDVVACLAANFAAFATVAAGGGYTLEDVALDRAGEALIETNFEMLNAVW